jgi:hypothetical protein
VVTERQGTVIFFYSLNVSAVEEAVGAMLGLLRVGESAMGLRTRTSIRRNKAKKNGLTGTPNGRFGSLWRRTRTLFATRQALLSASNRASAPQSEAVPAS